MRPMTYFEHKNRHLHCIFDIITVWIFCESKYEIWCDLGSLSCVFRQKETAKHRETLFLGCFAAGRILFFYVRITSGPASPTGECFTGFFFSSVVVNAQGFTLAWHSPGEKDLFRWLPLPQPSQCWSHRCVIRPVDLNNFTLSLIIFLFFSLSLLGVFEHYKT